MKRALTLGIAAALMLGALALYAQFTTNRPGLRTNIAPLWTTNRPAARTNIAPSWTTNRPAATTIVYWRQGPRLEWAYGAFGQIGTNAPYCYVNAAFTWTNNATFYGGLYQLQVARTTNNVWVDMGSRYFIGDFRHTVAGFWTNSAWPLGTQLLWYRARLRFVLGNFVSTWSPEVTNNWDGP
ncbi:MAG: hypothetical protein N3I86_06595 [Verrucomicrobiae bacterium]|nr:hypothetical protein [Verrucomicrobiae bacterium]MDW8308851.1 hypothetical protein [Verrucomicrobiales bacterium]